MDGFFPVIALPMAERAVGSPQCGQCGLYKSCHSPKMPPSGKGKRRILIVAEAPGKDEDAKGKQLVGNSGQELEGVLRSFDVSMRIDCVLTNALICRPPNNDITNDKWVDYCRPNLIKTLKEVNPRVVIPIGKRAVQSLIPYLWKDEHTDVMEPWVGWQIPSQTIRAWVCPTWHPSYLLREKHPLLDKQFRRHLEAAVGLADERPPDYMTKFGVPEPVFNDKVVAKMIRRLANGSRPVAYDYETNRLKPDGPGARIRCVGFSDGRTHFAAELTPRVEAALRDFLRSDVEKWGYNEKFEGRWSKVVLGVWPKNSTHCGMTTAHVLDGRKRTTSLKFQSFVRFGWPDYDSHISPYLEGKGGYGENQVFDLPTKDVLTYCATDAMLEFFVARQQRKELERYENQKKMS